MNRRAFGLVFVQGFALSLTMLSGTPLSTGQVADQPGSPSFLASPPDVEGDAALLSRADAEVLARLKAAGRLLVSTDPNARETLEALLDARSGLTNGQTRDTPPGGPRAAHTPDAQTLVLRAIAASPSASPWLAAPLIRIVRDTGATDTSLPRRIAAVSALASVRTRDAVRGLITIAEDRASPATLRAACFQALTRLSGHEEFGDDLSAWSLWLTQIEWLPEAEWRRVLAEGLAARADAAARDRDLAVGRLTDDLRKALQAATTIDDRSRTIERALRDDLEPVQQAGFAMALQELANTRPLDQRIPVVALDLLRSDRVSTRRSAAELLSVLAPPGFAEPLANALERESDASVASRLLRCVARWPVESVRPVVLSWIEAGEPARSPAIDAAEALYDRAWLTSPVDRARLLSALAATPIDTLAPSGVRLLYALGSTAEHAQVRALLTSVDPARRQLIGEVLSRDAAATSDLVSLARTDASMFVPALKALTSHDPNADSFYTALALAAPNPEVRRLMLLQLSSRLSVDELLTVARDQPDAEFRESLLARLTTEPIAAFFTPTPTTFIDTRMTTMHPSMAAGLLLLARTRLDLDQPALALKALDALTPLTPTRTPDAAIAMRTEALVWVGRVDEAAKLQAGVGAWIDGLRHCIDQPHAPRVLEVIEKRFGTSLSEEQSRRLASLRESMQTFVGPRPQ